MSSSSVWPEASAIVQACVVRTHQAPSATVATGVARDRRHAHPRVVGDDGERQLDRRGSSLTSNSEPVLDTIGGQLREHGRGARGASMQTPRESSRRAPRPPVRRSRRRSPSWLTYAMSRGRRCCGARDRSSSPRPRSSESSRSAMERRVTSAAHCRATRRRSCPRAPADTRPAVAVDQSFGVPHDIVDVVNANTTPSRIAEPWRLELRADRRSRRPGASPPSSPRKGVETCVAVTVDPRRTRASTPPWSWRGSRVQNVSRA